MDSPSETSYEQLHTTLQDHLTNFLNAILEQAGLLVDKAGEILRQIIPQGIPPLPAISLSKLKRILQFRHKDPLSKRPGRLIKRTMRPSGAPAFELMSQTISASNI
ncbi:hypothetical protein AUK40_04175 [Candidatus Wirthbacteria bacterium CG2_30_54_11]|uniref:Uncharacterized protein n=1 Tax=Candidatus Wirthbacteria bacterium CG2_30_54_11 TaxID=1817892 RepID=A0A1J5J0H2_9BACT|nr:MAG: hypothetical protein AUK40_04175 [Candidatus Wirthbacteria bacterium CG2_30_54_11]